MNKFQLSVIIIIAFSVGLFVVTNYFNNENVEIDTKSPVISDIKVSSTYVNEKEGNEISLSFHCFDEISRINNCSIIVEPIIYEHFLTEYGVSKDNYNWIFPPETDRIISITPIDGVYNEMNESFTVIIPNIIGGKEYNVTVSVTDENGNYVKKKITTQYIRQHSNLESAVDIIASYMNFYDIYWEATPAGRWNIGSSIKPLMGNYSSSDPIVISKQIDWAIGYGVNIICFDFGWFNQYTPFDQVAIDSVLTSQLSEEVYFTVLYFPDRFSNLPKNRAKDVIVNHFDYLAEHYFSVPSYYQIDEKPLVFIIGLEEYYNIFNTTGTYLLFQEIKNRLKQDNLEPFFIFELDPLDEIDPTMNLEDILDGFFHWGGVWAGFENTSISYTQYSTKYQLINNRSKEIAEKTNVNFCPLIIPGFNDWPYSKYYQNDIFEIRRNDTEFNYFFKSSIQTINKNPPLIFIHTWNDFHEGTSIEPSIEYGFRYLNYIKDFILGKGIESVDRSYSLEDIVQIIPLYEPNVFTNIAYDTSTPDLVDYRIHVSVSINEILREYVEVDEIYAIFPGGDIHELRIGGGWTEESEKGLYSVLVSYPNPVYGNVSIVFRDVNGYYYNSTIGVDFWFQLFDWVSPAASDQIPSDNLVFNWSSPQNSNAKVKSSVSIEEGYHFVEKWSVPNVKNPYYSELELEPGEYLWNLNMIDENGNEINGWTWFRIE